MIFSDWMKKDKEDGGFHECKVSLFHSHDPIMVIRFWDDGPIIFRGYHNGKTDHMVGSYSMCSPIRNSIEEIKEKAIECAVEIIINHMLMDLSDKLKEIVLINVLD